MTTAVRSILGLTMVAILASCDPFGLPATRAVENGAESMLRSAGSYEIAGDYIAGGKRWTIDLQLESPDRRHLKVRSATDEVEAIIIGPDAYFRGKAFLAAHLGRDAQAQNLARVAGNAWWKDSAGLVPSLPSLTEGPAFRSNFLGPTVSSRTDHQSVDGVDAVELSGARADVYIASAPPYRLLRVHLQDGVVVDGISDADLKFRNVDQTFGITAPRDVIDFGNLSTLPPLYTAVSVDTSACSTTCIVSARLKNLGGTTAASAPSTVTFTMTDPTTRQVIGTCETVIQPDVGYNSTTTASCTISGKTVNAAIVTATVTNPGRG
jgi:hypothetical protein